MRITISLEYDVAARLERLRAERPFKEVVNEALRRGLDALEAGDGAVERYVLRPVAGHPRRADLDNVAELIAETEGDASR